MKQIICLILLVGFMRCYAQEETSPIDFIVLDTVQYVGEAKYDVNKPNQVQFKRLIEDFFVTYPIDRVSRFRSNNTIYFRKNFEGRDQFMKMKVLGGVSLFEFGDQLYMQASNETMILLNESNYKNELEKVFGGKCDWDFNRSVLKFNFRMILNLIHNYNQNDCYKLPKSPWAVNVGVGSLTQKTSERASVLVPDMEFNSVNVALGISKEFTNYRKNSLVLHATLLGRSINENLNGLKIELNRTDLILGASPKYYIGNAYILFGPDLVLRVSESKNSVSKDTLISSLGTFGTTVGFHGGVGYLVYNKSKLSISTQAMWNSWSGQGVENSMLSFGFVISK